jgi:hypothetical protein
VGKFNKRPTIVVVLDRVIEEFEFTSAMTIA